MNRIFVTGGAGYIGSHTCVELLLAGYQVVIYDNFSNSHPAVLERIQTITEKTPTLVRGDIRDQAAIEVALRQYPCQAVIHFAGLKSVNESLQSPLKYYENNVTGTLSLLRAMQSTQLKTLVFSSSATVYGNPCYLPINEEHPLSATHPYGKTKLVIEDILRSFLQSQPDWRIRILRYFNPVGAHASGIIGEDPCGMPSNLMPLITQVAIGQRKELCIWGADYPTEDGTGIRDYIHVVDLAIGHLKALSCLEDSQYLAVNLGTGRGYSVLEIIKTFEHMSGKALPHKIQPRRAGDIATCYADTTLSEKLLGWKAQRDLAMICKDSWHWQQKNPTGYRS